MQAERRINATHKAINKPLMILGAERKLFFVALIMGAATFNLIGSLLGGLLIFGSLFLMAQWATRTDPQILRILLNSSKFHREYDPAKYSDPSVRVIDHA
jgi:type IV secretory pathway TrbD component